MTGRGGVVLRTAAAWSLLVPLVALAQPATPATAPLTPVELRFDIARYIVEGNTLLQPEEI